MGYLRIILHYQRYRRCGTVLRDVPLRWIEPVEMSPPVRGEFIWGNAFDHNDFDTHAWPGPRLWWDILDTNNPPAEGHDVYPMANGIVMEVVEPAPTPTDPDPNHYVTMWHPEEEIWTGYFHLKPGSIVVKPQSGASAALPLGQLGGSGTVVPHLHTGGHALGANGLGQVVPLKFAVLNDANWMPATQTPANGIYHS